MEQVEFNAEAQSSQRGRRGLSMLNPLRFLRFLCASALNPTYFRLKIELI
jgi:hypothetical protein